MVERGDWGAIVNVSSVASSIALTDHLAYCEDTFTHNECRGNWSVIQK